MRETKSDPPAKMKEVKNSTDMHLSVVFKLNTKHKMQNASAICFI